MSAAPENREGGHRPYEGRLVCLKKYHHRHEADIAKGFLLSRGIECLLSTDDCGSARPYLSFLTPIRLMVREEDKEQAMELLGRES